MFGNRRAHILLETIQKAARINLAAGGGANERQPVGFVKPGHDEPAYLDHSDQGRAFAGGTRVPLGSSDIGKMKETSGVPAAADRVASQIFSLPEKMVSRCQTENRE